MQAGPSMTERAHAVPTFLGSARLARVADGLVIAVAVSLPWSTSATSILIALWLLALIVTIDPAMLRREALSFAGATPLLLWLLAAVGMLWADAPLGERLDGLAAFHKLLVIPLLLAQSRRPHFGKSALIGFLCAAVALLVASMVHAALFGRVAWLAGPIAGVPVKDYISQSNVFVICIFALLWVAVDAWGARRYGSALGLVLLALMFLADIAYVVTGRTALAVIPILAVLFGFKQLGWKGMAAACVATAALAAALWASSPYLRDRVQRSLAEVGAYEAGNVLTSGGLRLEFWSESIGFVAKAPLLGHGTGSISAQFREGALAREFSPAMASQNPHQQILSVAIQLGLIGAGLLIVMWAAHLALFSGPGLTAWIGLTVVVQNVVSSQFNPHLFDFTEGWLYVFGVGVIGGMVRRAQAARAQATAEAEA
jgi:hypothetical protein